MEEKPHRKVEWEKGTHTWEMVQDFHMCPDCGYINENREPYHESYGKKEKVVSCGRCQMRFTITKKGSCALGPLL